MRDIADAYTETADDDGNEGDKNEPSNKGRGGNRGKQTKQGKGCGRGDEMEESTEFDDADG